jgi:signal transduction histidine kinase
MKTPSTKAGSSRSKSKTSRTSRNTSEIEQVKLDLLSLVSHELRTPLSVVLNAVRILREDSGLDAEERKTFLEMAFRNAERLNTTLSQLLDLGKLVSGRLVCRFHEVSLKQLLHAELERASREAARTGTNGAPGAGAPRKISVVGAVDGLPVILGDAPRLGQVLSSLFENAIRFSPAGARIRLRIQPAVKSGELPKPLAKLSREHHEYVLLELSNPIAPGIQGQLKPSEVIKVFGQREDVLDRAHEGVGGSLAIAEEVLAQHGGGLGASTAHDKSQGDTFTVWLALPVLENQEALLKVLESRIFALRTEVGAVSLMVLKLNGAAATISAELKGIHDALKTSLFRATDTVYSLPDSNEVAVLMDDCKKDDAPKIVRRLLEALKASGGAKGAGALAAARVGLASCPEDGTDPEGLIDHARSHAVGLKDL